MTTTTTETLAPLIPAATAAVFLAEIPFHLQGNWEAGAIGAKLHDAFGMVENRV